MLLERTPWGGDGGKGDAVGRNAFAYVCWPNEPFLKQTMMSCMKMGDDGFIQFYRYPNQGGDTMSRDHVGGIIVALYMNRDWEELDWVLNNLPWRLNRKYSQTIDFWLWQKALKFRGTMKGSVLSTLFFLVSMLTFIFILPYNFIIRKILGIKKLKLNDFPIEPKRFEIGWRKWLFKSLFPHFALFLLAWQGKTLPNSIFRWIWQKMLLLESNNPIINSTLGKSLTKEEYHSFEPYTSFVWSRRIETSDDVYIVKMHPEQSKFNDLNRGMMDYFWRGMDRIMLDFPDEIVERIKTDQPIINYWELTEL